MLKTVFAIIAITAAALVVSAAACVAALYFVIFYSPHKGQNEDLKLPKGLDYGRYGDLPLRMIENASKIPFETVTITSEDGLELFGRLYLRCSGDAPLAIGFHGYRGTPARDFSGGLVSMLDAGFNVLLAEQRGHGRSGGHTITFGIKEHRDCVSWTEYAVKRFGPGVPIVLFGISMGASTVLMASGEGLPQSVRLIAADCPYNSPEAIIRSVISGMGLSAGFLWPFVNIAAKLPGRFDPGEITARESVARSDIPVVMIHGAQDSLVPCEMSAEICEGIGRCRRFLFENADHGMSYLEDKARYEGIVADIFREISEQDRNIIRNRKDRYG